MSAGSFRGELHACAAMARLALQKQANRASNWLSWMLAGVALLLSITAAVVDARGSKATLAFAGIFLVLLVVLWWVNLLASIVEQNAGVAKLVPGIGRRSIKVLAVAYVGGILVIGAPFVLAGLPVVALGATLFLGMIAAGLAQPRIWLLAMIGFLVPELIMAHIMPLDGRLVLAGRIGLGILALVLLLRTLKAGTIIPVWKLDKPQATGTLPVRRVPVEYAKRLARDCALRDPGALLLHCLRPLARPATLFYSAILIAIVYLVSIAMPSLVAWYADRLVIHLSFPALVIFLHLLVAHTLGTSVGQSTGEQALVMLVARRPPSKAVNALLARDLTLRYGRGWFASSLVLIAVSGVLGAGMGELVWLLVLCLMTLTAGARVLKSYAVVKKGMQGVDVLLAFGGGGTVAIAIYTHLMVTAGLIVAGGWLACAVLAYVVRYQAMQRAPVAFPVGRLA